MSTSEISNLSTLKGLSNKRKIILLILIITILLFPLIIIGGVLIYNSYYAPYWNGGKWEDIKELPFDDYDWRSEVLVEFDGKMYLFYQSISVSTYTGSDCITPDQYSLSEIILTSYDGNEWSMPIMLSDPDDNSSEAVTQAIVYNDKIYLIRSVSIREKINDDNNWESYYWNKTLMLQSYDGTTFETYDNILNESEMGDGCGSPTLFVWKDYLWGLWKSNVYYEYNDYNYKFFNGEKWSESFNFTMPVQSTNDVQIVTDKEHVWLTWQSSVESYFDDADIYLGRFNGTGVSIVEKMTPEGKNEYVCRPHICSDNTNISVQWEGIGIFERRYSENGLSDISEVILETRSSGGLQVYSIYFKLNLYVLWSDFTGELSKVRIACFDGEEWSNSYVVSTVRYPGCDDPKMFVYDDSLFVYWNAPEDSWNIVFREYQID